MIVEYLVLAVMHLLAFVINNIPVLPVLTWISDNLQLIQWIAWANYYLPLEDFVGGITAICACWVVSAVIRVVIELL